MSVSEISCVSLKQKVKFALREISGWGTSQPDKIVRFQ